MALSRLGLRVAWWSKLPDNPLGRRIENEIRRWGVDTAHVLWDASPSARAGVYYLDFGLPPRGIDVYYDRADSSASRITAIEVDAALIAGTRLLHLTGITPALSPYCAKAVARALALAKEHGVLVSFDTNYRSRLWTAETARRELEPLFASVDLLFCPQGDAETLFGIAGSGAEIAAELRDRYEVKSVVVTCAGEGAAASTRIGDDRSSGLPVPARSRSCGPRRRLQRRRSNGLPARRSQTRHGVRRRDGRPKADDARRPAPLQPRRDRSGACAIVRWHQAVRRDGVPVYTRQSYHSDRSVHRASIPPLPPGTRGTGDSEGIERGPGAYALSLGRQRADTVNGFAAPASGYPPSAKCPFGHDTR